MVQARAQHCCIVTDGPCPVSGMYKWYVDGGTGDMLGCVYGPEMATVLELAVESPLNEVADAPPLALAPFLPVAVTKLSAVASPLPETLVAEPSASAESAAVADATVALLAGPFAASAVASPEALALPSAVWAPEMAPALAGPVPLLPATALDEELTSPLREPATERAPALELPAPVTSEADSDEASALPSALRA